MCAGHASENALFRSVVWISASEVVVAKNMEEVLCKWTPREIFVKYQYFSKYFRFSLFLECLSEISRKSVKSEFTRGPGRGDTCYLSVFDETLPG